MLLFVPRPRLSLAAVCLALPVAASGACGGGTACFQYTPSEYAVHGNSCPAQDDALPNFSDPDCPGAIVAVNSAGTFDGQLCCYAVTFAGVVPDCGVSNPASSGDGEVSPPGVSVTMGVGGFGPSASVSETVGMVGTGTGGSVPGCVSTCSVAVVNGGVPCSGGSLAAYNNLQSCVCGGSSGVCPGGPCDSFCDDLPATAACDACLQGVCSAQLSACNAD
jgi:hypothetical protein